MKLYRITVHTADVPDPKDAGKITFEQMELSDIIEFTLENPPADTNPFSVMRQYEANARAAEAAEESEAEDPGNGYPAGTIGSETR